MKERIKTLCKKKGVSMNTAEKEIGLAKGYISKLEKSNPNMTTLQRMADYFNVTTDFLMTGKETSTGEAPELTARDERDISRRLEQTLADLEGQQGALMFDGAPLDDETKELLKASLEHSIRVAKINAKKFTNKRYLKDYQGK